MVFKEEAKLLHIQTKCNKLQTSLVISACENCANCAFDYGLKCIEQMLKLPSLGDSIAGS